MYLKYSGRVKPELLNANTYSLVNYDEFESVNSDFKTLENRARALYEQIPADGKDAYYQLVLHPIEALSNLYSMYFSLAKNKLYAKQGRITTNALATQVDSLFKKDESITNYYNKIMAGRKWDHMMDQTHIGYTSWQQPEKNIMPKTVIIENTTSNLGLSIEGSDSFWKGKTIVEGSFPTFNVLTKKTHYFEVFNTGNKHIKFNIKAPSYILIEKKNDILTDEKRIFLKIDWLKAPIGNYNSEVIISAEDGTKIVLPVAIENKKPVGITPNLFLADNGYIAMEAPNYSRAIDSRPIFWKTIVNYGKTTGGVITTPVTSPVQLPSENSAHLEYDIFLSEAGTFNLNTFISPTIDFTGKDGLNFAISVDEETPVMVNISKDYKSDNAWGQSVANNIKIFKTPLKFGKPGKHTIKYFMVNPGVVLQKLVLDLGGLKPSFLGPPESHLSSDEIISN